MKKSAGIQSAGSVMIGVWSDTVLMKRKTESPL
jgi:hypothetical protein